LNILIIPKLLQIPFKGFSPVLTYYFEKISIDSDGPLNALETLYLLGELFRNFANSSFSV